MRIMQDEQTLNVPLDEQAAAVLPFDADAGDEPLEDETEGAGADYVCQPYLISADVTGWVNQFPNDPVPTWGKHRLRQADEREYESFLAMMPSRKITAGKGRGGNASSRNLPMDVARAANKLYNLIGKRVSGYEFDTAVRLPDGSPFGTGDIMDDVDLQAAIIIQGATDDDYRRLLNLPERGAVPQSIRVYDLIPASDKAAALSALAAGTVERKREKGRAKRLGSVGARTWTFLHKIGVTRRADGTLTPPVHQIEYEFEEWGEKTFRRMKEKAYTTTHTPLNGGGAESTTVTHLRVVIETFDKSIRELRGAVFAIPRGEGEEPEYVPVDVRKPEHLRAIPPAFKLGATTRMYLDVESEAK
jgi:hypothetical protein